MLQSPFRSQDAKPYLLGVAPKSRKSRRPGGAWDSRRHRTRGGLGNEDRSTRHNRPPDRLHRYSGLYPKGREVSTKASCSEIMIRATVVELKTLVHYPL